MYYSNEAYLISRKAGRARGGGRAFIVVSRIYRREVAAGYRFYKCNGFTADR